MIILVILEVHLKSAASCHSVHSSLVIKATHRLSSGRGEEKCKEAPSAASLGGMKGRGGGNVWGIRQRFEVFP